MEFKKFDSTFVLRLNRGEEIIQTIIDFCEKEKVFLGEISGIGSASSVEIGSYDVVKKEYFNKTITETLEITALTGNITTMNDKPYIHCHITVGDTDFRAFAGHLKSGIVSGTCEIIIKEVNGKVERKKSEEIGLNLFEFI